MEEKTGFYCWRCSRSFKKLDHFNRYANKQLPMPCEPVSNDRKVKIEKIKTVFGKEWRVVK